MTSARPSKDPLCRFYTREAVGGHLVDLMDITSRPVRVVDLACGPGVLAEAAGRRWRGAELVTVDVDPAIRPSGSGFDRHAHVTADALDADLPRLLGRGEGFDVALCNPPYRLPEWCPDYTRILDEAGLGGVVTPARTSAEVLFVAQNIRLARPGGRIGLLVPDGLITGRRSQPFRAALLAAHQVCSVVQLPEWAFRGTGARAYMLIVRKGAERGSSVELRRLDNENGLSPALSISRADAEERLDYAFHAIGRRGSPHSLRKLGATLTRGWITSVANWRGPVFHTTSFPTDEARREVDVGFWNDHRPEVVCAEAGDIILARVDRRLHRKVCGVATGRVPLSSAVLRLRVATPLREAVLSALLSADGEARLASISRGVGPRMIGQADLLDMELPI